MIMPYLDNSFELAVKALCKKHKAACNGVEATRGPFEELTASLDDDKVRAWRKAAERADCERGEALDIYALKMDKGIPFIFYAQLPC
jgi:hypothetical protein